jgi:hypothetical protein
MADELGKRVDKLEERLDQHLSVIHAFIESDKIESKKREANRQEYREEFHRRLIERSKKKRAIFRSIQESSAIISKLIDQRNAG